MIVKRIDGHFWYVSPEGNIIDPWFDDYELCVRVNGLNRNKQQYLPADDFTQKLAIKYYANKFGSFNDPESLASAWMRGGNGQFKVACCHLNAMLLLHKYNGEGKIVFGSMGWTRKIDNTIWWEYGGTPEMGFKTFKDFQEIKFRFT